MATQESIDSDHRKTLRHSTSAQGTPGIQRTTSDDRQSELSRFDQMEIGHQTDSCYQLKELIERLIQSKDHAEYVLKKDVNPKPADNTGAIVE